MNACKVQCDKCGTTTHGVPGTHRRCGGRQPRPRFVVRESAAYHVRVSVIEWGEGNRPSKWAYRRIERPRQWGTERPEWQKSRGQWVPV